ncbi:MAG: SDR family NAD(P)-dependent oxidoreductase [Pseudomonadota bacterium]
MRRLFGLPALLAVLLLLGGCALSGSLSSAQRQSVAGKTYVVTGASSGFGRGVAVAPGGMGANVVLAARRTELLNGVAAEVTRAGGVPLVVTTDVSKAEQVEHLAREAIARFGRIDVWINNAGVGAIGRFEQIPLADHTRIIEVNVNGVIYGSHAALRHFRLQGAGTLVNIGSIESEVPTAYQATYAASKAAVLSLGRTLNEELRLAGAHRIRVATVMPWAADTPFFTNAANYSGHTPRPGPMDDPADVVAAIVRATIDPQEEHVVGWKAKGAYLSHRILPDLSEYTTATLYHKLQMQKAPPTSPTSGSLHQPRLDASGIEGGHRARIERENAAPRP